VLSDQLTRWCCIDRLSWHGLPDISNNVGPVKPFLSALLRPLRRVVLFVFFALCIDDHGSFVIDRSASVRPRHLFDQNFDHDYFFKLPSQGVGCPFICSGVYFTPCPVPSCPTYEPNSNDGEYAQPFRHIQYKRTPSFRPIATLAMLLCRRIAK
jgi:hypothetical protein